MSVVAHHSALSSLSKLSTLDQTIRLWLRRNTRLFTLLSDALRTLAFLTPSPDAELHAEAAATLVSLISLYRDLPPPHKSIQTRFTIVTLSVLHSAQLFLEMLAARRDARHQSDHKPTQLRAITLIEAAKLTMRLSLLANRAAKGHILTSQSQTLPQRPPPPECTCGMAAVPGAQLVDVTNGPRSGRKILRAAKQADERKSKLAQRRIAGCEPLPSHLKQHHKQDPILDALFLIAYERRANWVVRMFVPDVACEACAGQRVQSSSLGETVEGIQRAYGALKPGELAAEVLYVARPLLHLLLIRRYGWRSWRAWSVALFLDLGSRLAMAPPTSDEDEDERKRRMAQLILYLGRSPLFDVILRSFIRKMTSPLRRIPLIGGATSSAVEWITLLQQYWFYTSGS